MLGDMLWILGVYRRRLCIGILGRSRNGRYGIYSVPSNRDDLATVSQRNISHRRSSRGRW